MKKTKAIIHSVEIIKTGEATTVQGIQQNCCELLENSNHDECRGRDTCNIHVTYM